MADKPYIVGLTGGIASGKSTVSRLFSERGVPVIDADIAARDVVKPGSEGLMELVDAFGDAVLTPDGELDRRRLREIVFADEAARRRLESILHPKIRSLMAREIDQLDATRIKYCLKVVPLLVETQQQESVDRVLVVDTDRETQLARIQRRDHVDQGQAERIIASQISREQRLAAADDRIDNNDDNTNLEQRVEELHRHYLELAKRADRKPA